MRKKNKLSNKISIKKFCPNLSSSIQERWQRVFDFCIQEARNPDNETYIAVSNKKPCAILTYHRQKTKNNYLDGVCAIPDEEGEKTPLAGRTLIYQLFKDSNQSNDKRGIVLEAIHNGPVNVIDKYEKLGFTAISSDGNYTLMTCNKFKVAEELKKFKNEIEYIETDPEKIDSKEFID